MHFSRSTAAALAVSLPLTVAQTFTDCDPTKKSCPNDVGLNQNTFTSDFTSGSDAANSWTAAAYSTIKYGSSGAEFSISNGKQAPTIETDFNIFFGRVDVKMKAAKGTGIVSSIVFESTDLDEIDWEFLGGDSTQVQSNFYGKGNTTSYDRVLYIPVSNPQDEFHTYTVDWNSDRIEWMIDGKTVRTLTYDNPLTVDGHNFPQTPMRIKLGNWCGGCDGQPKGTVQWAGGKTNFDDAPYTMYVESVQIANYNPANEYEWTDRSGDWQSIKLMTGDSTSSPEGNISTSVTIPGTQTEAPTQSHSVGHVHKTEAAVSTTRTVPKYGMGNESATAHGSNGGHTQSDPTSVIIATTQVPAGQPTGGAGGLGGSSGAAGSPGASASGSASGQDGTNAASLNTAMISTSVLWMLFSLLLL